MMNDKYWEVVEANILLHSTMSDRYNATEPHFRPENVANVEARLVEMIDSIKARSLLDLGCGTGFIIDIAKKYLQQITGVDVTQAMLDQVDVKGTCNITLIREDTGSVVLQPESYDLATAYSFLHHLYDITPTLNTAWKALKKGGKFYVDLEPNYYFWQELTKLNRSAPYSNILKREIESVCYKDEEIEKNFRLKKEIFNNAEFGKTQGGFKDEELIKILHQTGFRDVQFYFYWYLGQGFLINDPRYSKEERFQYAKVMNEILQQSLPMSKHLFKYLGFVATK
jgi:ubiquinone/menaquinone biosynthesis C-methylase UbiE